jgi:dephospho-CoA kinase
MLRVGLTGGLGSGKSTVGRIFAELGAQVVDADELGRRLMQPGQQVYRRIVEQFGPAVVRPDGALDRRALAELAFAGGRLEDLNRIVHPAAIAAQEEWMRSLSAPIAIVESALVFEVSIPGWKERFDRIILVTAPDELKIRRFVARSLERSGGDPNSLADDARKRLAAQIPDAKKIPLSDWVIDNSGDLEATRAAAQEIYAQLREQGATKAQRRKSLTPKP